MTTMDNSNVYANLKDLVALQHQASGFSFLPKQPVHSILAGRHSSRLRGRGLNFEELRHYHTGDDIRTMDWKVTNRTGKPHVRVYTEEKERPVLLLVDQRISMFFGSQLKMKSVIAAELTALSAWRALSGGDRVGALVFNDTEIVETRPQRSRKTVMQIFHNVLVLNHALNAQYASVPNNAQLNITLKKAEQVSEHDCLIVIISDMSGWNAETVKRIKRLRRHNDVIASLVFDELEKNLPSNSQLVMSDGEMQIQVDAGKAGLAAQFTEHFESGVEHLQAELNKHGIPVIPMNTTDSVLYQVKQAMGERASGPH
ncbi:MAG: DUF58 domain-containing protein [Gammaproteobacteria bacterium]|nr:MAG: DUF58 domain-containing protein [Gammaproteobacteria bacterium]